MAKLSIYLPPFTGDYSGVCSALFDFNCLIVLCDASCCTKNYIDYDEPRWSRHKATAYCAQLRAMEVTLGDDSRVLRETAELARSSHPDFIALLGSPVPAIVGMDMTGMARQLEADTGIPALGFDTTGFSTYQRGVERALIALYRRFSLPDTPKRPNSVNLLGVTPIDFGVKGGQAVTEAVESMGFPVNCCYSMDCSLEQVRQSAGAAVNLVVSASGLALAREMEREHGIPYVAATPIGADRSKLAALLRQAMETGKSVAPAVEGSSGDSDGLLIVGEQLIANSIRLALRGRGETRPITVGSFFTADPLLSQSGDLFFDREADLIRALRSGRFTTLLGDPLLARIPEARELKQYKLPHPAISGRIHWDEIPGLTGAETESLLEQIIYRKEFEHEI